MPALPRLALSAARDSRLLDSRQIREAAALLAPAGNQLSKRAAARLWARQSRVEPTNGAIPTWYRDYNVSPGAVVGIVLGSIVGFLLIIWLFTFVSQGNSFIRTSTLREEEDYTTTNRHHRRRSHRTEMRSRSPRRERIVRQERIVRDRSIPVGGSIPPPRAPSRIRETIIVEEPERRVSGDDIVEVIEEHSSIEPPRRKSRRGSGYSRY